MSRARGRSTVACAPVAVGGPHADDLQVGVAAAPGASTAGTGTATGPTAAGGVLGWTRSRDRVPVEHLDVDAGAAASAGSASGAGRAARRVPRPLRRVDRDDALHERAHVATCRSLPSPRSARNSRDPRDAEARSGPIPASGQKASARSSSSTDGSPTAARPTARADERRRDQRPPVGPARARPAWTTSHSTTRPFSECGVSAG